MKNQFHRTYSILIMLLFLLIIGTSSPVQAEGVLQTREQLLENFKTGRIILSCEFKCLWKWLNNKEKLFRLHNEQSWDNLAEMVIKIGHTKDINYYLLGRAAEGLGFTDAAIIYYEKCISLFNDNKSLHHCRSVINGCGGLDLSKVVPMRLAALRKAEDKKKTEMTLNEATIKNLFAQKYINDKQIFEIEDIHFEQGYFIDEKTPCAIVSFRDINAGRNFMGKLWLLIYDNGWKIQREIVPNSNIYNFKVIKIGKGIMPALYLQGGCSGQGEEYNANLIIFIDKNKDNIVWQIEGYDMGGTGNNVKDFKEHHIDFQDVNGDGLLEIIVTEKKGFYNKAGRQVLKHIQKSIYKFNGRKFEIVSK